MNFRHFPEFRLLSNPGITGTQIPFVFASGTRLSTENGERELSFYKGFHKRLSVDSKEIEHSLPVRGTNPEKQLETSKSFEPGPTPHGIGLVLYSVNQSAVNLRGAMFNYAYHKLVNRKANLSFGFSAGYKQFNPNGQALGIRNLSDSSITSDKLRKGMFDLSVGGAYATHNYFIGVAFNQVNRPPVSFGTNYIYPTGFSLQENWSINYMAGLKLWITDEIGLYPSVQIIQHESGIWTHFINARIDVLDRLYLWYDNSNNSGDAVALAVKLGGIKIGLIHTLKTTLVPGSFELSLGIGSIYRAEKKRDFLW